METPTTECQAVVDCYKSNCGTQTTQCLGPNWDKGDFKGGACEDFYGCVMKCDCNDTTCAFDCFDSMSDDCAICLFSFAGCAEACDEVAATCAE